MRFKKLMGIRVIYLNRINSPGPRDAPVSIWQEHLLGLDLIIGNRLGQPVYVHPSLPTNIKESHSWSRWIA